MNKELAMILKQYKLLEPDDLPEIEEDEYRRSNRNTVKS